MSRCLSGVGLVAIASQIFALSSDTVVVAVQSLNVILSGTPLEGDNMFSTRRCELVVEAPLLELLSMAVHSPSAQE